MIIVRNRGPDVPLPDEDSGVVNGLGHARLEDKGLEAAFEKVLDGEGQHVIELVLCLVEKSVTEHSSEKCLTLEDSARVLLIQSQQIPGIVTDTAEGVLNPPQLPLAAKPVLPNQLQLGVQTLLLVWTTRLLERFPIYSITNKQITYSILLENGASFPDHRYHNEIKLNEISDKQMHRIR